MSLTLDRALNILVQDTDRPSCMALKGCSNEAIWRWTFELVCEHQNVVDYCVFHHERATTTRLKIEMGLMTGWRCSYCNAKAELISVERIRP